MVQNIRLNCRKVGDQMNYDTNIVVYTDGGCQRNPGGVGGYGVVVLNIDTGEFHEYTDSFASTTNNRMEVMAILRALQETSNIDEPITIVSDSQYAIYCAEGAWSRNKNVDLWEEYERLSSGRTIKYLWVRGHSGNTFNERCDELATLAMQSNHHNFDDAYERDQAFGSQIDSYTSPFLKKYPGGSMAIKITVPNGLDKTPEFTSVSDYCSTYQVNKICANLIRSFYNTDKHSFKSYAGLKTGGMDHWSRMKKDKLFEIVGTDVMEVVNKYFESDNDRNTCCRWICRGLTVSDAIRKTFVDMEISVNCSW